MSFMSDSAGNDATHGNEAWRPVWLLLRPYDLPQVAL